MDRQLMFDYNEFAAIGEAAGTTWLQLPPLETRPLDFTNPLLFIAGAEWNFRYPLREDDRRNYSVCATVPLQLAIVSSDGPSLSVPVNSTSIWLSVPCVITANMGLGSTPESGDKFLGTYIGAGMALNKAFIREKSYVFTGVPNAPVNYHYRFPIFPTVNATAGLRFRGLRGYVRNIGVEGSAGFDGIWTIGIVYGTVSGL
ncbi:MAG TPA: hypothetical protein VFU15_01960 [Bacteroidia bacterium]|nr:hypothetical protein [Bacteroidia bacterium]